MTTVTTVHNTMLRQDRAIENPVIIKAFLHRSRMIMLSIHDEPYPYIVPLSYGYELDKDGLVFYFHGAPVGHKIDLFKKNPKVSFCIAEPSATIVIDDPACRSGQNYFSVCGHGEIEKLEGDDRLKAINLIMHHYAGDDGELSWEYPPEIFDKMAFWALRVVELSAKSRAEPIQ